MSSLTSVSSLPSIFSPTESLKRQETGGRMTLEIPASLITQSNSTGLTQFQNLYGFQMNLGTQNKQKNKQKHWEGSILGPTYLGRQMKGSLIITQTVLGLFACDIFIFLISNLWNNFIVFSPKGKLEFYPYVWVFTFIFHLNTKYLRIMYIYLFVLIKGKTMCAHECECLLL